MESQNLSNLDPSICADVNLWRPEGVSSSEELRIAVARFMLPSDWGLLKQEPFACQGTHRLTGHDWTRLCILSLTK